jgi:hypothetical protein
MAARMIQTDDANDSLVGGNVVSPHHAPITGGITGSSPRPNTFARAELRRRDEFVCRCRRAAQRTRATDMFLIGD